MRQRLAECEFREESLRAQFEQQEKVVEALQQRQSQLDECAASLDAQRESLIAQSIELDSINEGRAELECQRQEISQQQDTIYDKSAELAQLESELKVWSDSREQEEELLRQVESLQQEISAAAEYRNSYWNDLEVSLSEQKALVQQLTEQLQVATRELEEAHASRSRLAELERVEHRLTEQEAVNQELTEQLHVATLTLKEIQAAESTAAERLATASDQLQERDQLIGELLARLAEQSSVDPHETEVTEQSQMQLALEEREHLIRELQEQLTASINVRDEQTPITDNGLLMRSRELDGRTTVLDRRDDELGDWNRRLKNTEEELESERRQLQEARQQLELARAELQVSIEQSASETVAPHSPEMDVGAHQTTPVDDPPQDDRTSDLPSELASLFGLGGESDTDSRADTQPDIGTEGGDSVVMSFDGSHNVLLEAQADRADSEADESDDNDYVTRYMEQLLARNRTVASGSLPEELNRTETTNAESDDSGAEMGAN